MTRLMDPSLEKLSNQLSEMGQLAIKSVEMATDSYLSNKNTVNEVKDLSNQITTMYNAVGDLTFSTLIKYQPVASDFRFIRSTIEISNAYHRFGRYAYDITQVRNKFGDISDCKTEWLYEISAKILHMIKSAVESFAILDIGKAKTVEAEEEYVDKLYKERIAMLMDSENTKCALAEALLLRYLERIGDHAVSMARDVNFIVTGKHKIQ